MFYQIAAYIKFLLKSTNEHGVHSPFVFNLVTRCFYNKTKFEAYKNIATYKKDLLKNNNTLTVTDFGAGSHKGNKTQRSIKNIARYAGTTNKRSRLLYRLVQYFNSETILELGTSLGIATHAMGLANPEAQITTVEGCSNISETSKNLFKAHQIDNITSITSEFGLALNTLKNHTYDLIFFDGNHQKKATLAYFETLLPSIHNDTVFIFDDIHWSKDMTDAWETIKQHPKVTVTIDTFYWGFVFFRKEQAKEHFVIRL
ncbi:O-methyltransferase [Siansivirga zeaxanthinifaciens]|uniref:Methyltransferase n=1 Tax=Siansivirga zeaxanthinifaciens CC-SAMT-1 TaxID=1454006 RepID=A0A0C5WBZ2_9FLAO|nr:class I SAM-dependent methyltransferase [Siansivirga zeaxanthinifaciens]AJR03782.1 methyltransferase [Siansivirga zeaxanthinifaciens CC-SAMT-1]